jgi:hypothetical protein
MTRSAIFPLMLVGMTVAALQHLEAGSAVVNDGHGHTTYSFGHSKAVAIQRALETARLYGWTDARLIGASDATGYGAIAVAQKERDQFWEQLSRARRVKTPRSGQLRCVSRVAARILWFDGNGTDKLVGFIELISSFRWPALYRD